MIGAHVDLPAQAWTVAVVIVLAAEFRVLRWLLPAPAALTGWATRAVLCRIAINQILPALDPASRRCRQWRAIRRTGFAVLAVAALCAVLILRQTGVAGAAAVLLAPLTLCRLWTFQHQVNWWHSLEREVDALLTGAAMMQTLGAGRAMQNNWQDASGETFHLLNPFRNAVT